MDILRQFQSIPWCKPDWCYPSMGKEMNDLLKQCIDLQPPKVTDDVNEIIEKSRKFPIPFPIDSIRLETLIERRPLERLKRNIVSTYPIIHERVLLLMTHFLIYKREFGTSIEKSLYSNMTVPEFIDRLLKKRAVSFLTKKDNYKLLTGESGTDGWETVGTLQQKPPLELENCLSYDEIKLSAMVYISGYTECINDGNRSNAGVVNEDNIEEEAVIIGLIGPRFERPERMDYEDILITEQQNTLENGYGEEVTPTTCLNVLKTTYVRNNQSAKHMWRQIWSEFYQAHSYTYQELTATYPALAHPPTSPPLTSPPLTSPAAAGAAAGGGRYVPAGGGAFDNELYYKRVSVLADAALAEGEARAAHAGRCAFINVVGCGLGVWKISDHQTDVYVLTFLERIRYFLKKDLLNNVSDVNFAYIKPSQQIMDLFTGKSEVSTNEKRIFFESKRHPRGGINVQMQNREPSSKLSGEHEGKLLVMTYPWDGNAHPGNEFWLGSLTGSGDPAAACSTQVAELHNAHVSAAVCAANARVAGRLGLRTVADYCVALTS